jgi:hypothetical protein
VPRAVGHRHERDARVGADEAGVGPALGRRVEHLRRVVGRAPRGHRDRRDEPGEAQVDFGHALVKFQGTLTKAASFVMALPHSDAFYVRGIHGSVRRRFKTAMPRRSRSFRGFPGGSRMTTPRRACPRSSAPMPASSRMAFCNCRVTICSGSTSAGCGVPTRRG